MRSGPLFALILGLLPSAAEAACRLALALAVDVSRSVDAADYLIQTEGLARALTDPAVEAAIFGPAGDVAILVYHWSGQRHQEIVADWQVIRAPEDLTRMAEQIRMAPRFPASLPTALGEALRFGLGQFETAPICDRQVLDVAGDGQNNEGLAPLRVYAKTDFGNLVVNGLAIGEHESGLTSYYEANVMRGDGAFVEVARTQADYPRAIRRKLIRELSETVAQADPALIYPEKTGFPDRYRAYPALTHDAIGGTLPIMTDPKS